MPAGVSVGDFDAQTRVAPSGPADGKRRRYAARLSSDWEIWGPNGGYLASIALRACGESARIPRPVSFSCHFLRRGAFDGVEVNVEVMQAGRRSESLAFTVDQGEQRLAAGLLRTAAESDGLVHDVTRPPDVPGPHGLATLEELSPDYEAHFPFWANFDRCPPDQQARAGRPPEKRAPTAREWLRFRPAVAYDADPFLDAARSVVLIDTFTWPAAVGPHAGTEFIAPNVDLQVWFHRARPASEWLLVDAESALAEGGLMATHSRVWSDRRELVASGGAQLLCVAPRPAAPPAG